MPKSLPQPIPTQSTRIFLEKMKSRNYRLEGLNGWLAAIGDACMSPGIVRSTFASGLGASNAVIGLIPSLMGGGLDFTRGGGGPVF